MALFPFRQAGNFPVSASCLLSHFIPTPRCRIMNCDANRISHARFILYLAYMGSGGQWTQIASIVIRGIWHLHELFCCSLDMEEVSLVDECYMYICQNVIPSRADS